MYLKLLVEQSLKYSIIYLCNTCCINEGDKKSKMPPVEYN